MSARLGLALYTLRGECARDPEGTLRAVAEMGYEGVELYDLFGREAQAVREMLDQLGLEVCGSARGARDDRESTSTSWPPSSASSEATV